MIWLWFTLCWTGIISSVPALFVLFCVPNNTTNSSFSAVLLTVLTVLPAISLGSDCSGVYRLTSQRTSSLFLYRIVVGVCSFRSFRSIFSCGSFRIFASLQRIRYPVAALVVRAFGCLYSAAIYTLPLDWSVDIDVPLLQFSGLPVTVSRLSTSKL